MHTTDRSLRWVTLIVGLLSLALALSRVVSATDQVLLIRFLALTTVGIFLMLVFVAATILNKL